MAAKWVNALDAISIVSIACNVLAIVITVVRRGPVSGAPLVVAISMIALLNGLVTLRVGKRWASSLADNYKRWTSKDHAGGKVGNILKPGAYAAYINQNMKGSAVFGIVLGAALAVLAVVAAFRL